MSACWNFTLQHFYHFSTQTSICSKSKCLSWERKEEKAKSIYKYKRSKLEFRVGLKASTLLGYVNSDITINLRNLQIVVIILFFPQLLKQETLLIVYFPYTVNNDQFVLFDTGSEDFKLDFLLPVYPFLPKTHISILARSIN